MKGPDGREWPNIKLEFIPIGEGKVFKDEEYQKDSVNQNHVRRIAREFVPHKCWPIMAAKRGSQYAIMDGWHRILALRSLGITCAPALVYTYMTVKTESTIFGSQSPQDTKRLTPVQIHKAKIAEGNQVHVDLERVLNEHGIWGNPVNRDKYPLQLMALGTARDIVANVGDGGKFLSDVLTFLFRTFGKDAHNLRKPPLKASALLVRYLRATGFDLAKATSKLEEQHISKLMREADGENIHSLRKHISLAMIMVKYINNLGTGSGRKVISPPDLHSFANTRWLTDGTIREGSMEDASNAGVKP